MPKIKFTIGLFRADSVREFEMDLTKDEYETLKKFHEIYYNLGIGIGDEWIPSFQMLNMTEIEEEEKKKETERARMAYKAHMEDVRKNGSIAVAFRNAMANKNKK